MSIFDLFKTIQRTPSGPPEFIIAGLGNPDKRYEKTRHNLGFDALDSIASKAGARVDRAKFDALTGTAVINGKSVLLVKPQTYMNASGTAVSKAADFYKIPPEKIIVLCDDVAVKAGSLRIRPDGSDGGHKGLRSIIGMLGTDKFIRIRIGAGMKPSPEYDMADWVLSKLPESERKLADERIDSVYGAVELIVAGEFELASSKFNVR